MLKSQAPSRQRVKARLPAGNKRQKTTPTATSTAAPTGGTAGGRGGVLGTAPPAIVSRSHALSSLKVSVERREGGRSQSPRGWQDPPFQIENVVVAADRNKSAATKVPAGANRRSIMAPTSRSSATTAPTAATGPVRRVKVRSQQQPAAAEASAEIDWRVPPTSTKPRRDQKAAASPGSASGRASSRRRSEARAGAGTMAAERSPARRRNGNGSSGGAQSSSTASKSSNARGRTGCASSSPRKKSVSSASAAAATAAATTMTKKKRGDEEKTEGKGQQEEGVEEKLPPCPYPGHKNVSWTCRGCGGARHHLTSRSAMEPLQRVHGFKVQVTRT